MVHGDASYVRDSLTRSPRRDTGGVPFDLPAPSLPLWLREIDPEFCPQPISMCLGEVFAVLLHLVFARLLRRGHQPLFARDVQKVRRIFLSHRSLLSSSPTR